MSRANKQSSGARFKKNIPQNLYDLNHPGSDNYYTFTSL